MGASAVATDLDEENENQVLCEGKNQGAQDSLPQEGAVALNWGRRGLGYMEWGRWGLGAMEPEAGGGTSGTGEKRWATKNQNWQGPSPGAEEAPFPSVLPSPHVYKICLWS